LHLTFNMCEALEACVPLCICVFRGGVYLFYCLGLCIHCACEPCCRECDRCCAKHCGDSPKTVDNVDAPPDAPHWMDGGNATSVSTNQPTTSSTLQAPSQSLPHATGTSFDIGTGWGDTHYYEKAEQAETVQNTSPQEAAGQVVNEQPSTGQVVAEGQPLVSNQTVQTAEITPPASAPPSYEESIRLDGDVNC